MFIIVVIKYQGQPFAFYSSTFLMSFWACDFASFIFCLRRKLSSRSSFKLCSLSAKSMDRLSFSVSKFYNIFPHYTPQIHFYFSCLFCYFRISILYLFWFLWSVSISKPEIIWSYLSSMIILLCSKILFFQMFRPWSIPFFTLFDIVLRAITIAILFLLWYYWLIYLSY